MLAVPLPCQHADHILQLPYPGQQLLLITAAAAMHLTSCTIATRRRHRRGPRRMPDLVHGLPHGLVQVSSMHCVSVAVRLGRGIREHMQATSVIHACVAFRLGVRDSRFASMHTGLVCKPRVWGYRCVSCV